MHSSSSVRATFFSDRSQSGIPSLCLCLQFVSMLPISRRSTGSDGESSCRRLCKPRPQEKWTAATRSVRQPIHHHPRPRLTIPQRKRSLDGGRPSRRRSTSKRSSTSPVSHSYVLVLIPNAAEPGTSSCSHPHPGSRPSLSASRHWLPEPRATSSQPHESLVPPPPKSNRRRPSHPAQPQASPEQHTPGPAPPTRLGSG